MFFEDDYDYEQHLRPAGLPGADFLAADERALAAAEKEHGGKLALIRCYQSHKLLMQYQASW